MDRVVFTSTEIGYLFGVVSRRAGEPNLSSVTRDLLIRAIAASGAGSRWSMCQCVRHTRDHAGMLVGAPAFGLMDLPEIMALVQPSDANEPDLTPMAQAAAAKALAFRKSGIPMFRVINDEIA